MLGLKYGDVVLCDHEEAWVTEAADTIAKLREILGSTVRDAQHIGSTSIRNIKAKPVVDIAISVDSFDCLDHHEDELTAAGFHHPKNGRAYERNQRLLCCGSYYDGDGDLQSHFIHVVLSGSEDMRNYVKFRDYLNSHPEEAIEYEKLKLGLVDELSGRGSRYAYTDGKMKFIEKILNEA